MRRRASRRERTNMPAQANDDQEGALWRNGDGVIAARAR